MTGSMNTAIPLIIIGLVLNFYGLEVVNIGKRAFNLAKIRELCITRNLINRQVLRVFLLFSRNRSRGGRSLRIGFA